MISLPDPLDYLYMQQQQPPLDNLLCKQETELEALKLIHSSTAVIQLPQLESPSLPPAKRPTSLAAGNSEHEEEQEQLKVTDWRALDKFIASQLSHDQDRSSGPEPELEPAAGFGVDGDPTDIAVMLNSDEFLSSEVCI